MATDPELYNPIYIRDVSDLPVAGPDDYSKAEKRRAAYEAEIRLESDVNSGKTIPSQYVTDTHRMAILLFATYRLQAQVEAPSDVTLGDARGDNNRAEEQTFGSQYKTDYEELVDRINERSETGSPGVYFGASGDGTTGDVAVNTRDDDIMHRYPFTEQDRFPRTDR